MDSKVKRSSFVEEEDDKK